MITKKKKRLGEQYFESLRTLGHLINVISSFAEKEGEIKIGWNYQLLTYYHYRISRNLDSIEDVNSGRISVLLLVKNGPLVIIDSGNYT